MIKFLYILFFLFFISCLSKDNRINTNEINEDQTETKSSFHKSISIDEFVEIYTKYDYSLIDVRTYSEYSNGHIKGSQNIDFYSETFTQILSGLDKSKVYMVYCRSGNRSFQAMLQMKEMDFLYVYNMEGGINEYINLGYPVEY